MSRLVLGTAQWGDPYGVTNERGRLSDSEIDEIVHVARERGIHDVDTARGYGDAESRLRRYADDFAITAKVSGALDVSAQVGASIEELGTDRLASVLIHDWDALEAEQQAVVVEGLAAVLDSGLVERVGVSIYDHAGIDTAVSVFSDVGVPLGALQVPANPLDRRLDGSDVLLSLREQGAHITVRSAFLQGVLLSESGRWTDHRDVRAFGEYVEGVGRTRVSACLAHVSALPWATHVVVGVTSAPELVEVCDAWKHGGSELLPASLGSADLDLIDPRRWVER